MKSINITFSAEPNFKDTLNEIKEQFGVNSISAVIVEAVKEYKIKKEREIWHKLMREADKNEVIKADLLDDLETGDVE